MGRRILLTKAAKYLLYRHFCAQEERVVESEVTNRLSEKIMSRALRNLLKMLYAKKFGVVVMNSEY